jgi:hypothetical protein
MLDFINAKHSKITELGIGVDLDFDFQSLSFSDPLPPNIGIPHGTNDLSETPRYGQALEKRTPAGANIDRPKAGQIGTPSKIPQNQPMVPGATVHQINRTNKGQHAMSINPALADAGFEQDGDSYFAEKHLDSSKCEKTGFTKRRKLVAFGDDGPENAVELVSYHNNTGDYIGDERVANMLAERGIYPELASDDNKVCSVGYCEKEDKWYGWSHRAMYGFGVGDSVKEGDCGFVANTPEQAVKDLSSFYGKDDQTKYDISCIGEDEKCFKMKIVKNVYSNEEAARDRDKIHIPSEYAGWSMEDPIFQDVPKGAGSWQAKNLADVRNMACDFAESVSSAPVGDSECEGHVFGDLFKSITDELDKAFAKHKPSSVGFHSESSSAVYPPANFRWYTVEKGGRTNYPDIKDPEVEYSLDKGDKIGIYYNTSDDTVHLVTDEALDMMFVLTPNQAKAALKKCKPFGGKIDGVQTKRGNGSIDEIRAAKALGRSRDINSNKLKLAQPTKAEIFKPKGKATIVDNPDKKVFLGFFKPDLDRDRFEIHSDTSKAKLTKVLKDRASAKPNLGSELYIAEVQDRHPLSRKSSNGMTFVKGALINKLRDTVTAKTVKTDFRIGAKTLELPKRNPMPLNIDVPFGPGVEIITLRKLRDQIEQHNKISAAFAVRENDGSRKADRGIYVHQGVNILQFISPDASKVYESEAKAFVRRIKNEVGKMFKADWRKLIVVENNQRVERVIVTVLPNMKKGSPELRKRNKTLYKMLKSREIDRNNSYIVRTKGGDVEVRLVDVNWLNGKFIVKPERANLDEFESEELWSLTTREKIL